MGPLKLGINMMGVSKLLGPPTWWMEGGRDDAQVPLLWGYGRYLEVLFNPAQPYEVVSIKLTALPPSGASHFRAGKIDVSADGFADGMCLSDFLRRPIWELDEHVSVGVCQSIDINPVIDICSTKVRVVWCMSTGGEDVFEKQVEAGASGAALTRSRDVLSDGFFGIYSTAYPRGGRFPSDDFTDLSRDEYLEAVGD
ncbi:hypothetical protein [Shinella sp. M31]|uniref:hypothetical protein n=1 Tax=Shinella sp. M31 TaxID=3368615 RepID=UPI003BA117BB